VLLLIVSTKDTSFDISHHIVMTLNADCSSVILHSQNNSVATHT
jgi:hypothetical protein